MTSLLYVVGYLVLAVSLGAVILLILGAVLIARAESSNRDGMP
jgi:hypothetical protein